jgi:nucleotide-binding universal stress UspA family protein
MSYALEPEGESLRRAVRWISDARSLDPATSMGKLVEEAGLRFDLPPLDQEFLRETFTKPVTPADRPKHKRAFHRVLCAIDFSPASRAALHMAARLGDSVTLLHVTPLPTVAPLLDPKLDGYIDAELAAWQKEINADERDLVAGSAWEQIVERGREGEFDLIVLGTLGRSGLAHVLVGSVAERVIRHASCPVLVVRH